MDRKTAHANLFITFHLLILFLITFLTAWTTQTQKNPWMAFVYYLGLVALPVFLYVWLYEKKNPWKELGFARQPLLGMAAGLVIGGVVLGVFLIIDLFSKPYLPGTAPISLLIILGTVATGFAEEVLFRGFVLPRMMAQMTFIKANIFSSGLFAVLHAAVLVQLGAGMVPKLILLFVISLWLGYLFKRTRSIWTVIWVHILYNFAVLLT